MGELSDKARAMALPDHAGLADELIDATRPRRLRTETLVPDAKRIAFKIGEGMIVDGDDELLHVRVIEIATDQCILLVRLTPPAHDIRRFKPAPDQREIAR